MSHICWILILQMWYHLIPNSFFSSTLFILCFSHLVSVFFVFSYSLLLVLLFLFSSLTRNYYLLFILFFSFFLWSIQFVIILVQSRTADIDRNTCIFNFLPQVSSRSKKFWFVKKRKRKGKDFLEFS